VASRFPHLKPWDYYVWETLEDKFCMRNPHSFQEVKDYIPS
jgi:hypothetical protein